jgi:hypothetical protein
MLVMSKVCSSPSTAPIDSMSKSQLAYSRRVKDKVAKQLNKYKEMLAKVVADSQVVGAKGYSKAALDAMKFAPTMGMTWGDEDNKLLDLFSAFDKRKPSTNVSTSRVKGSRELKNLDYTLSLVKCRRRRGFLGSKNAFSFPPEVQCRGFG